MTSAASRPGLSKADITTKADSVRATVCAQRGRVAVLGIRDLLKAPRYTVLVEVSKGTSQNSGSEEKRLAKGPEQRFPEIGVSNLVMSGGFEEIIAMVEEHLGCDTGSREETDELASLKHLARMVRMGGFVGEITSLLKETADVLSRIRDRETQQVPRDVLRSHQDVCKDTPDITVKTT